MGTGAAQTDPRLESLRQDVAEQRHPAKWLSLASSRYRATEADQAYADYGRGEHMTQPLNAEEALIGSIILGPYFLDTIGDTVTSTDFADTDLGAVFALMQDMHRAGEPVGDSVLLLSRLEAAKKLKAIGGYTGLFRLSQLATSARHAPCYAAEIAAAATRRRLGEIATGIRQQCREGEDSQAIAGWIESQLRMVTARESAGNTVTIAEASMAAIQSIDQSRSRKESIGVPFGLWTVDEVLGGLYPGELIILAARPSIGKSALAAQIASHNADKGRAVLFVSLEMTSSDIALRAIAGELGIDSRELRAGRINDAESNAAKQFANSLAGVPFFLWSGRSTTVAKIRSAARVQQATTGLSLLIVDYIGLVHATDRRKARWEQITEVSSDLKSLALELNIPVLALCQLNREAEKGTPKLDHLRDAGAIEQDADVVMLLHREARNSPIATLDIAKARNGVTGPVSLTFDCDRVRFSETQEWTP
jgi:replicative DNA helicase